MARDRARSLEEVLGAPVDALSPERALDRVCAWAQAREHRSVCFCNVHAVVTARTNPDLARALEQADLVAPDGAPIAWMMRRQGRAEQQRICGPDFFWSYCARARDLGQSIFLLGATPQTLDLLQLRLREAFPGLRIADAVSPPFREATPGEDAALIARINASGASTVWVALGCPTQEIWIDAHRDAIAAVLLGVGAAFDFHAGTVRRAPELMRDWGLEWLHRLATEPRRLWRRYLVTNSLFLALATATLFRRAGKGAGARLRRSIARR
jgi:N-acetylglucosaminyldiphosphoundecaprenol N-acetyl-beta-D-mannosaminyltransferase